MKPNSGGIRQFLPKVYAEFGGEFLDSYLRAADGIAASCRDRTSIDESREAELRTDVITRCIGLDAASRCGSRRGSGSDRDVRRFFLKRGMVAPAIWPTLSVFKDAGGRLRFARDWRRSAILAWFKEDYPSAETLKEVALESIAGGDSSVSGDIFAQLWRRLMPAACTGNVVWLDRDPEEPGPTAGSSVRGKILR
ncbi:MAG: hypothetical protein AAF517_14180 [Planctomycetota bacterium]